MLDVVSRRMKPLGATLTAAALAVSLSWLGAGDAKAENGKTITAVMQADVKIFDPIVNTADITARFALMVYDTLFSLDANLVPHRWVAVVKEAIRTVAPRFSARRMVKEYTERLYAPSLEKRGVVSR